MIAQDNEGWYSEQRGSKIYFELDFGSYRVTINGGKPFYFRNGSALAARRVGAAIAEIGAYAVEKFEIENDNLIQ